MYILLPTSGRRGSGTFEAFKKQPPSGMFCLKILKR
jgi:hypothetical protein